MSETPIVSVIVTTFNRIELLKQTVESILSQTFKIFELIIVDDGSTDNTEIYISNILDERVRYIKTENWGGPAKPRNIGIRNSRGKYIAFCDDDDIWVNDKLETQLTHFSKFVVGIGSTTNIVSLEGKVKKNNTEYCRDTLLGHNDILKAGMGVPLSSLIVKQNSIRFCERREFISVEDFDYQINLLQETGCKIKQLSRPLVQYRIQEGNISLNINNANNIYNIYKKYNNLVSNADLRYIIFKHNYRIGRDLIVKLNYYRSRKYLLLALFNYRYIAGNGAKFFKLIIMYLYSFVPFKPKVNKIISCMYNFE